MLRRYPSNESNETYTVEDDGLSSQQAPRHDLIQSQLELRKSRSNIDRIFGVPPPTAETIMANAGIIKGVKSSHSVRSPDSVRSFQKSIERIDSADREVSKKLLPLVSNMDRLKALSNTMERALSGLGSTKQRQRSRSVGGSDALNQLQQEKDKASRLNGHVAPLGNGQLNDRTRPLSPEPTPEQERDFDDVFRNFSTADSKIEKRKARQKYKVGLDEMLNQSQESIPNQPPRQAAPQPLLNGHVTTMEAPSHPMIDGRHNGVPRTSTAPNLSQTLPSSTGSGPRGTASADESGYAVAPQAANRSLNEPTQFQSERTAQNSDHGVNANHSRSDTCTNNDEPTTSSRFGSASAHYRQPNSEHQSPNQSRPSNGSVTPTNLDPIRTDFDSPPRLSEETIRLAASLSRKSSEGELCNDTAFVDVPVGSDENLNRDSQYLRSNMGKNQSQAPLSPPTKRDTYDSDNSCVSTPIRKSEPKNTQLMSTSCSVDDRPLPTLSKRTEDPFNTEPVRPIPHSGVDRYDGGRYSLRAKETPPRSTVFDIFKQQQAENALKQSRDFSNMQRRMKYDPLKAASSGQNRPKLEHESPYSVKNLTSPRRKWTSSHADSASVLSDLDIECHENGSDTSDQDSHTRFQRSQSVGRPGGRPNRTFELRKKLLSTSDSEGSNSKKPLSPRSSIGATTPTQVVTPTIRSATGSLPRSRTFDRSDGGRHSVRITSSAKAPDPLKSRSKFVKPDESSEAGQRTVEELKAWRRRHEYDPKRAMIEERERRRAEKLRQQQEEAQSSRHRHRSTSSDAGGDSARLSVRFDNDRSANNSENGDDARSIQSEITRVSRDITERLAANTRLPLPRARRQRNPPSDFGSSNSLTTTPTRPTQPLDTSPTTTSSGVTSPPDTMLSPQSLLSPESLQSSLVSPHDSLLSDSPPIREESSPLTIPSPRRSHYDAMGNSTDRLKLSSDRLNPAGEKISDRLARITNVLSRNSPGNGAERTNNDRNNNFDSPPSLTVTSPRGSSRPGSDPQPSRSSRRAAPPKPANGDSDYHSNPSSLPDAVQSMLFGSPDGGIPMTRRSRRRAGGSSITSNGSGSPYSSVMSVADHNSSDSGSVVSGLTPPTHLSDNPQASYDSLVISSIYTLTQKLRSNTMKSIDKLKDNGFVDKVLLPPEGIDESSRWTSANQQLTAILANLLKVDQHIHVINKGVSQTISKATQCEKALEEMKYPRAAEHQRIAALEHQRVAAELQRAEQHHQRRQQQQKRPATLTEEDEQYV